MLTANPHPLPTPASPRCVPHTAHSLAVIFPVVFRYAAAVARLVSRDCLVPVDGQGENSVWRPHPVASVMQPRVNIRTIDDDTVRVVYRHRRRRDQLTLDQLLGGAGVRQASGGGREGGYERLEGAAAGGAEAGSGGDGTDGADIVDETIDEVESWRVYYELYEGAVVLNQGRKFLVHSLELARGIAYVAPADVRYYTRSLDKTIIIVLQRFHGGSDAGGAEGEGGMRPEELGRRLRAGKAQPGARGSTVVPVLEVTTGGQGRVPVLPARRADAADTVNDSWQAEGTEAQLGVPLAQAAAVADQTEDTVGGAFRAATGSLPPACAGALAAAAHYGRVRVQLTVSAYVKIWQKTGEIFEEVPLHLPPKDYDTRGCWIDWPAHAWVEWTRKRAAVAGGSGAAPSGGPVQIEAPPPPRMSHPDVPQPLQPASEESAAETGASTAVAVAPALSALAHGVAPPPERPRHGTASAARAPRDVGEYADLDAALHAAAHAVLAVIPLHLTCSASDIGCECGALREHRLRSRRLLFYDKQEGGIGLTQRAAAALPALLRSAREMVASCGCVGGCWMCIHSSKCPEYNICTSKQGALAVLDILLDTPAKGDPDAPSQPPPRGSGGILSGSAHVASKRDGVEVSGQEVELILEEEPSMLGKSVAMFRRFAQAKDLRESARVRAGS